MNDPTCRHTPCPEGYIAWHSWAERKSKTHRQLRCPSCGLFAVWVPRAHQDGDRIVEAEAPRAAQTTGGRGRDLKEQV